MKIYKITEKKTKKKNIHFIHVSKILKTNIKKSRKSSEIYKTSIFFETRTIFERIKFPLIEF